MTWMMGTHNKRFVDKNNNNFDLDIVHSITTMIIVTVVVLAVIEILKVIVLDDVVANK